MKKNFGILDLIYLLLYLALVNLTQVLAGTPVEGNEKLFDLLTLAKSYLEEKLGIKTA